MAFFHINNVAVRGMAACVPKNVVENEKIYKPEWGDYQSFVATTGIERHRNTTKEVCSSDLCVNAADNLMTLLKWDPDSVDVVVFVTQTPDYLEPATSCIIQSRLGLPTTCMTLDISLGCSGWVHALGVIGSLMQNGTIKRGLLLAGETPSKHCSPEDKSTYPLFGDAGTATALEFEKGAFGLSFLMNTDGEGHRVIMIPDGGYRNQVTPKSLELRLRNDGAIASDVQLQMDGMSVFSFAISKVPVSIKALVEIEGIELASVDYVLLHQGNYFMNEKIRKKLKLTPEQVPYSLKDYGNTSCASIPLTMVSQLKNQLETQPLNVVGCGFGIGLSWGTVTFKTDKIVVPSIIEI